MKADFLKLHDELVKQIKADYGNAYYIASNDVALDNGTFPAIGLLLTSSDSSQECNAYVPIAYNYILCTFDMIDRDDEQDYVTKQRNTFDLLEDIIRKYDFAVTTDIELQESLAIGEGSFIIGWSAMITFNA